MVGAMVLPYGISLAPFLGCYKLVVLKGHLAPDEGFGLNGIISGRLNMF